MRSRAESRGVLCPCLSVLNPREGMVGVCPGEMAWTPSIPAWSDPTRQIWHRRSRQSLWARTGLVKGPQNYPMVTGMDYTHSSDGVQGISMGPVWTGTNRSVRHLLTTCLPVEWGLSLQTGIKQIQGVGFTSPSKLTWSWIKSGAPCITEGTQAQEQTA